MDPVELARNNKFEKVNERRGVDNYCQPELSVCKPELYFTVLHDQDEFFDENDSMDSFDRLPVLNNTVSVTQAGLASGLLLLHCSVYDNSNITTKQNGESIISTAEEHFDINHHMTVLNEIAHLKPKSQSSTTSLLKLLKQKITRPSKSESRKFQAAENSTITFNVDIASTPKKYRRSSTPKTIQTATVRKSSSSKRVKQFSSTVIKQQSTIVKPSKHCSATKTIPPPLLSSSYVHVEEDKVQLGKRKRSSSKKDLSNKQGAKKLKFLKESCHLCQKTTSKRKISYDGVDCRSVIPRISSRFIKNVKYPIKFYPNMRTQDIDRVNFVDDLYLGYDFVPKPTQQTSCYNIGDYNVWYL
jgi:hypothetical protein